MITLYTKPNCPFCDKAKEYFAEHDIDYIPIDVTEDDDAYAMIKERHGTVPQIYKGGKILIEGGWNGLKAVDPTILKQMILLRG